MSTQHVFVNPDSSGKIENYLKECFDKHPGKHLPVRQAGIYPVHSSGSNKISTISIRKIILITHLLKIALLHLMPAK